MPIMFIEKHGNTINKRPSLGQWIKHTWLDIFTLIALGGIASALWITETPQKIGFSWWWWRDWCLIPILFIAIPSTIILLSQISVRSFWDINNALFGLLFSIAAALCFAKALQRLVVVLSDKFLEHTFASYPDSRRVPGTNSTLAFASYVFLFLYLNAKLKVWASYRPSLWKLALLCTTLLGATMIAVLEALDNSHRYYHSIAGAVVGSFLALATYRIFYVSIFDYRANHIPLSHMTPYTSEAKRDFQSEYGDATITCGRRWSSSQNPRFHSHPVWTTEYGAPRCAQCAKAKSETISMGQDGMSESPAEFTRHSHLVEGGNSVERRESHSEHVSVGDLSVIREQFTEE